MTRAPMVQNPLHGVERLTTSIGTPISTRCVESITWSWKKPYRYYDLSLNLHHRIHYMELKGSSSLNHSSKLTFESITWSWKMWLEEATDRRDLMTGIHYMELKGTVPWSQDQICNPNTGIHYMELKVQQQTYGGAITGRMQNPLHGVERYR